MTKLKTVWVCNECGSRQPKWSGNCFTCKNWNTLEEEVKEIESKFDTKPMEIAQPVLLKEVTLQHFSRIQTNYVEIDRLIGGGIVQGSLTLVGGDPGIGKSTLMLQLSDTFTKQGLKVLYVCGEESIYQTSLRAKRLNIHEDNLYLLNETIFSNIKRQIEKIQPDILIIDSIQIIYKTEIASLPGSVTQVKEIAMECMHIAKGLGITTFIIGHITKSGELAGPKVLEHIVDTVLDFEGDQQHGFRMLRSKKNRFGPTDEVAVLEMTSEGLKEISNPSAMFLKERIKLAVGSVIIPTMEGSRSILVEIQALVAGSAFATSSRRCTGIDQNRLALLLAVLEKKVGYHFHSLDVFVSIAGGMKIMEPGIDLGIALSIASSFCNKPIDPEVIVIGEVGLAGEVRSVPRIESRLKEAIHMGFKQCIIPQKNLPGLSKKLEEKIEIKGVELVEQAIDLLVV
ncbi:MAG: DNA repair protein RadA [Chlamydiales bacterium]|nr:DNA repair protein RadA [Chlamydiales bacterium]